MFFFLQKFFLRKYFILPIFLILTENYNAACTLTDIKKSRFIKFSVKIYISFVKSFNISLDTYSLFLSRFKISFLMMIGSEQERVQLMLLSRKIINKLFRATANIQLCKFRFKEGLKLV